MESSRRQFIKQSSILAAASALPARWARADALPAGRKCKLRFAIASDLHYGQEGTTYAQMADDLVEWINAEHRDRGLDILFLNGDLTNDSTQALLDLRDKHLSKLEVPYYTTKGNHDFVDEQPGSPTESWEAIWGYPANHSIVLKDFAFVLADTSAPHSASAYLAADRAWMAAQFEEYRGAAAIFALIHISQRKHGVKGWPRHGVHAEDQVEQAEAVMDLLEATPNVRAVFHGHNHFETGMWVSGERRYFFDSHVGGNWGAAKGYRIVEVDEDHRMVTYQVNAEQGGQLNRNLLPG
ncbi:MAG: metallophosphoesterase family protein [Opitutales bacterium]